MLAVSPPLGPQGGPPLCARHPRCWSSWVDGVRTRQSDTGGADVQGHVGKPDSLCFVNSQRSVCSDKKTGPWMDTSCARGRLSPRPGVFWSSCCEAHAPLLPPDIATGDEAPWGVRGPRSGRVLHFSKLNMTSLELPGCVHAPVLGDLRCSFPRSFHGPWVRQ